MFFTVLGPCCTQLDFLALTNPFILPESWPGLANFPWRRRL